MINDTTGFVASSFSDGVGVAQARVAWQNAHGGVDGRKLKLVVEDSQSSPSAVLTAAKSLVETKGVFGIVSDSALFFGAAPYLTQAGVPVTGDGLDGPEWGTSANMFTYGSPTFTSYNGTSYNYTTVPKFMKSIGAKKTAIVAFASPSAVLSGKQVGAMLPKFGIKNCYQNLAVPLGGVDFTATVLQLKQAGCDSVIAELTESSEVGLASAIKNAGLHIKQYYYASYAQATLDSPSALAALNGSYGQTTVVAGHASTPAATQALYKQLKQYDPAYHGGLLDFGASIGWEGTDAMIAGLKLAGPNPTRASFTSKLRTASSYTIGGLSASLVNFNYLTGKLPPVQCSNMVQLKGSAFVPVPADGSATCGTRVAYKG
jgi:branched-chain amino acid transport system substrate-binding protein